MTRSSRFSNHLRPYGLDSWSAVAGDLLPNRLTALGQVSHNDGGVAQLGEHLPCKQGVRSSILLVSTIYRYGPIAQLVRAHA